MEKADTTVTGAQLAARIGCKPSYIVQLKRQGRVVASQGGGYQLDASLALYEQTKSPAHAGVAQRHAEARGSALAPPQGDDDTGAEDEGEGEDSARGDSRPLPVGDAARRVKALADRAETDAAAAQRDLAISLGLLLRRDDVVAVLGQAAGTFRATLERLADTLAPQLAAVADEHRCRELIWSEVSHALEELTRSFRVVGHAQEAGEE